MLWRAADLGPRRVGVEVAVAVDDAGSDAESVGGGDSFDWVEDVGKCGECVGGRGVVCDDA